ncbi:ImmA/IrrE family metallo-endopeptidase [Planococcus dechangensis]|uniref:ImmA/IrrE family metallo-endopeptidase n=1 Tax=Planococcus dechangensis TaxID=1176255 RepID=UPI00366C8CCE
MTVFYNHSEDYVNHMYQSIIINHPHQLDPEDIAARNGLSLVYMRSSSMRIGDTIVINEDLSEEEQWQQFGHELCHALWHSGNQLHMPVPFRVYQEYKANNFAQYACIPSFMLHNMKLPKYEEIAVLMIQKEFGVSRDFAKKRLDQHLQNLQFG